MGEGETMVKGYMLPVLRGISSGNLKYSTIIIVNNTIYVVEGC